MITSFVLAMLLAADGPATAEQAAQPAPEASNLVCRRIPEIGSRVRSHRVCKAKEDWAADRMQNRQQLERAQVNRGTAGGN